VVAQIVQRLGYALNDGGSIHGKGRGFSLRHCVQTGSGAHPASSPMGTGHFFHGVKRPGREADNSPPFGAQVLIRFRPNLSKHWVKHYVLRYRNLFVLNGIRRNCHSSRRNLVLYQFIKRAIRLTVIIIEESPSYQLPTKLYPTFFWPG
jgi:hypothetical protein